MVFNWTRFILWSFSRVSSIALATSKATQWHVYTHTHTHAKRERERNGEKEKRIERKREKRR